MPHWLKALVIAVLLIAGGPAVANAHGGAHGDGLTAPPVVTVAVSPDDQHATNAPAPARTYFEMSRNGAAGDCKFGCCCCQGASRCGSSSGCSMGAAMPSSHAMAPDLRSVMARLFDPQIGVHSEPVFGLERPPRV